MPESILTSIKKLLGITEEYAHFDADIIMHINTAFMILAQLGVGPQEGFSISDASAVWSDFLPDGKNFAAVKSYTHLQVRLLFDQTQSSVIKEQIQDKLKELEWRLNVEAESGS